MARPAGGMVEKVSVVLSLRARFKRGDRSADFFDIQPGRSQEEIAMDALAGEKPGLLANDTVLLVKEIHVSSMENTPPNAGIEIVLGARHMYPLWAQGVASMGGLDLPAPFEVHPRQGFKLRALLGDAAEEDGSIVATLVGVAVRDVM